MFERTLTVRFADVDYARVVYYPRYFDLCHQVFEDFFSLELKVPYVRMLQERNVGYPSVHVEADFRAPLRFGDLARVQLEALKVSPRALTCRYRFHRGDEPQWCAELRVVTAGIDVERFTGCELPADVRAAFERHLAVP